MVKLFDDDDKWGYLYLDINREGMDHEAMCNLQNELARVIRCVQTHYDQRGDRRCWMDDLKLYHDVLGVGEDPYITAMPPDPDAEESCKRYIRQRQHPDAHGKYPMPGDMTIEQLTEEVKRLQGELDQCKKEREGDLHIISLLFKRINLIQSV